MRRLIPLALLLTVLVAAPAAADPGVQVIYRDGFLRVTLEGSYAGAYYQVWRSGEYLGPYHSLSSQFTLCTGDCYLTDPEVVPGKTYYYRFDVQANGGTVSYGPFPVIVPDTPIAVRVTPNPSGGRARLELSVPGNSRRDAPVPAEARLVDLQGRTVRMLYSGLLPRGTTAVTWDGLGESGRSVGAGIYFVRLSTPLGASTTRLVRFR